MWVLSREGKIYLTEADTGIEKGTYVSHSHVKDRSGSLHQDSVVWDKPWEAGHLVTEWVLHSSLGQMIK